METDMPGTSYLTEKVAVVSTPSVHIARTIPRGRLRHGVIHVRMKDQEALCATFVRLQEFYESPFDDIRGHYFTLDKFKERYSAGGPFTYFTDWHGFNVPGHVVERFFELFADLTLAEQMLREATLGYDRFYLVGSHDGGDPNEDALEHELVHGTYYLDDDYRIAANRAVEM